MKRYVLFLLSLVFVFTTSCKKDDEDGIKDGVPSCVREEIINLKLGYLCENGANVKEYQFQENMVYVFNPGDCISDVAYKVLDTECNTLGYLGGIGGVWDIDGVDFDEAEFKRIIWED